MLKIGLYTAITERDQYARCPIPLWQRGKSIVRCTINRVATRISGRLFHNHYHYLNMLGRKDTSNRGDIGIRMAIRARLIAAFTPRRIEFVEIGWGSLDDETVAEISRTCDLFVIAGGGFIFIEADGSSGDRLMDVSLFTEITCPVIAYGIGLNRLMHETVHDIYNLPAATRQKIKALGAACQMISVRDADAQALFGLYSDRPAALIGDPVLFLGGRHDARRPAQADARPVLGINLAAHGWRSLIVLRRVLPHFLPFLRTLVRDHDPELVYFLHHDLERPVVSFLKDRGFGVRVVDCDPEAMIGHYAQTDFVICQMLHSCIFSANAGVPFLNIAYDSKSLAFASLLGVDECATPCGDADAAALRSRFDSLYERRWELAETIRRRKVELDAETRRFLGGLVAGTAPARIAGQPARPAEAIGTQ